MSLWRRNSYIDGGVGGVIPDAAAEERQKAGKGADDSGGSRHGRRRGAAKLAEASRKLSCPLPTSVQMPEVGRAIREPARLRESAAHESGGADPGGRSSILASGIVTRRAETRVFAAPGALRLEPGPKGDAPVFQA
jgi:hypothetical protein